MGCGFPGNVRELENCVQRTATLAHGPSIVGRRFRLQPQRMPVGDAVEGQIGVAAAATAPPAVPLPALPTASPMPLRQRPAAAVDRCRERRACLAPASGR